MLENVELLFRIVIFPDITGKNIYVYGFKTFSFDFGIFPSVKSVVRSTKIAHLHPCTIDYLASFVDLLLSTNFCSAES